MAQKPPRRLDVQIDGRTVYSQDVSEFGIERTKDGLLRVEAVEVGATVHDNLLVPPPPSPGAPDGDDEQPAGPAGPTVLERVHTGEAYSQLPTGTAADLALQLQPATVAELITDTTVTTDDEDPDDEAGEDQ